MVAGPGIIPTSLKYYNEIIEMNKGDHDYIIDQMDYF